MKIEQVNDHQIRCTLSKKELEKRDLKLSEIAYGNEKVKNLFRDMMRLASFQYGFEAEDIPLMIEVIPFTECAVIIITKVEDPEELDTRFSTFAPSVRNNDEDEDITDEVLGSLPEGNENVIDLFRKLQDSRKAAQQNQEPVSLKQEPATSMFYRFSSINDVVRAAKVVPFYSGDNSLYKNETKGTYLLLVNIGEHTQEEFLSYCNLLSEYALSGRYTKSAAAYIDEHFEPVIMHSALQKLSLI